MAFKKAEKKQGKLRLALFGVSGGGKTYSALRIAKGITSVTGGSIAVIDTERRSACKYSDRFDFDVNEMDKPSINNILLAFEQAKEYDVLIIDSLTHAWQELLEEIETNTNGKFKGNSWRAWGEGTPKQNRFIQALLNFKGHVIATMRVETKWTTELKDGKTVPVRSGEGPKQGKGIEYEFDMLMQIESNHTAEVLKDRTGKYQDEFINKPDEDFGVELINWLLDAPPVVREDEDDAPDAPVVEEEVEKELTPFDMIGRCEKVDALGFLYDAWHAEKKLTPKIIKALTARKLEINAAAAE